MSDEPDLSRKRVSIAWVKSILQASSAMNVDSDSMLDELKADFPNSFSQDFVPLNVVICLWQKVATASKEPLFGLKIGQAVRPGFFGKLAFLAMSAPDLKTAFHQFERYMPLISEGGVLKLESAKNVTTEIENNFQIIYEPSAENQFINHQIDAVLMMMLQFGRFLTGESITPKQVNIKHKPLGSIGDYQACFGVKPEFEATKNSIVFSAAQLALPLPEADQDVFEIHQALADSQLQKMLGSDLQTWLLDFFDAEGPQADLGLAASSLHMSARSLQRKLSALGVSFTELQDQHRAQKAKLLLKQNIPLQEIAERLGFSDNSAFHRAFKRWYGVAPGKFEA